MAVIAVWQCDRDGSMFEDKKQAEEHDKFLELAANITSLIENEIQGIDEKYSEAIGLLLARRREQLAKACKGKPDELLQTAQEPDTGASAIGKMPAGDKATANNKANVTNLSDTLRTASQ